MNETETRAHLIDPALKKAGWGVVEGSRVRMEFPINKGRLIGDGQRSHPDKADYILQYRNRNLAVIEAKARDKYYTAGVGQAKDYAQRLQVRYTYSTIGLFRHALFTTPYCDIAAGNPLGSRAALAPLLRLAAQHKRLTAALYTGPWTDVGTPERLAQLQSPVFPEPTPTAP